MIGAIRLAIFPWALDAAAVRPFHCDVILTKPKPVAGNDAGRRWTYAEMQAELPESNFPVELWGGELVTSPAPSFFHQDNGQYQPASRWRPGESAESRLLRDFSVPVAELFADTSPS